MSSSSTVAKSSVIVCSCPEALTDGTIHQGNDERWGFNRPRVKERGRRRLDPLPVLHHRGWANLKVFKLMLKALLLRETSCNKGWHCGGDAWGDCGGLFRQTRRSIENAWLEWLRSETNDQVITAQIPGTIFVEFHSLQRWMTLPHVLAWEPAHLSSEHCRLIY